jgi:hypothetical protein
MKKNLMNIALAAVVAFGAVAYTGCGKKGCTVEADDNYDALATEADPDACDETATVGKFEGNWTGNPGAYPFTVSQTGEPDYQFNISTNFGLLNENGTAQLNPTNVKATVNQNTATIALTNIYNGSVSGTITYASANSMSITYTLSNFPASAEVNGTYTEALTK